MHIERGVHNVKILPQNTQSETFNIETKVISTKVKKKTNMAIDTITI